MESLFVVVINHEGQYSIWPSDRIIPLGWEQRGQPMAKQSCLDFIREHWVDMTPRSLQGH